jgi:hypothetical protein
MGSLALGLTNSPLEASPVGLLSPKLDWLLVERAIYKASSFQLARFEPGLSWHTVPLHCKAVKTCFLARFFGTPSPRAARGPLPQRGEGTVSISFGCDREAALCHPLLTLQRLARPREATP